MKWIRSFNSTGIWVFTTGLALSLLLLSQSQSSSAYSSDSSYYTPEPTRVYEFPTGLLAPDLYRYCVLICDSPTPVSTPTPTPATPTPTPATPTPTFAGEWRRWTYSFWDPGVGCPRYQDRLSGELVFPPFYRSVTVASGSLTELYCYYEEPGNSRSMSLYASGVITTSLSGACNPVGQNKAGVYFGLEFFGGPGAKFANSSCWPFWERGDTGISSTVSGPSHMSPRFVLSLQAGCAPEGCAAAFADITFSDFPVPTSTPTPTPAPTGCSWLLSRELGMSCSGPLPGPGVGDASFEFSCADPALVSYTLTISPSSPYTLSSNFIYLPEHSASTLYCDTARGCIVPAPGVVLSSLDSSGELRYSGTTLRAYTYLDCGAPYPTPTPTPAPPGGLPDPPPGCRWSCRINPPALPPGEAVCFSYTIFPAELRHFLESLGIHLPVPCRTWEICVYDLFNYVTESMAGVYALFGARILIVGALAFYGFLAVIRLLLKSG